MPFERIGRQALTRIVTMDLDTIDMAFDRTYQTFLEVWQTLAMLLKDDLSSIPVKDRMRWIEFVHHRLGSWRNDSLEEARTGQADEESEMCYEALLDLSRAKVGKGLEKHATLILRGPRKGEQSIEFWTRSIERFATLSDLGLDFGRQRIGINYCVSLISRLAEAHKHGHGETANPTRMIEKVLSTIKASSVPHTIEIIDKSWAVARVAFISRERHARDLAMYPADTEANASKRMRVAISSLVRAQGGHRAQLANVIDFAIKILDHVITAQRRDGLPLIRRLLERIPELRSSSAIASRIDRLIQLLIGADMLPTLSLMSHSRLLQLLIHSLIRRSTFKLYKTIYHSARSLPLPYSWSQHRRASRQFPRVMELAVEQHQDLDFASKLYADFQYDGLRIRSREAESWIKAIAATPSESRLILLERHIKDWLYFDTGSRIQLCQAIISGLTRTKSAEDAWLAFMLVNRIDRGRQVDSETCTLLFRSMMTGPEVVDLDTLGRCIVILQNTRDPPMSAYTALMKGLSTRIEASPYTNDSRQRLGLMRELHTDIVRRSRQPSDRFLSLLIREFAQAAFIDIALEHFSALLTQGRQISPDTVGTLMIRLSMAKRYLDADNVRQGYMRSLPFGHLHYTRKLAGARVFLSTQRGDVVDLRGYDEAKQQELQAYIDAARGLTVGVGGPKMVALGGFDSSRPSGPRVPRALVAEDEPDKQMEEAESVVGDQEDEKSQTTEWRFAMSPCSSSSSVSFASALAFTRSEVVFE